LPKRNLIKGFFFLTKSKAQLRQDLMVLSSLNFKTDGFFIEFGATNGIDLSNSFLLEANYGWKGILAEPAKIWHSSLTKNRTSHIEFDCVWIKSNEALVFNEVSEPEISTISLYNELDEHAEKRKLGLSYQVNTISLDDLLKKYEAPYEIDFLSIDTEGSEYEILNSFDFSSYNIKIICCEHNFTPMRNEIYALLTRHGYQRRYEDCSLIDDWFFKIN
jgi:FkbM family methyltransferase